MKIRCLNPKHIDSNPSMKVYPEIAYCFSCGYSVPSIEVLSGEDLIKLKKEPENVQETIDYIRECPVRVIRGLQLPVDNTGYFITWPSLDFYKKRLFKGPRRYIGPRGRRAPLFEITGVSKDSAIVVEGELNALSLSIVTQRYPILSPGSATEFLRYLPKYLTFDKIWIIVDRDKPGVIAGLKLKAELLKRNKKVYLVACEKDINQILQDQGTKGVQAWVKENLEMHRRV